METPRARDGEQRVAADQWDIDGWQILASEAEKASFASANPVYERLVSQFPPIGKFWKSYAEHLARENPDDHDGIKAIYDRAVQAAPTSIEIWRSYVTFASSLAIKVPGSKLETDALATYERAISSAGLDLNANPLWSHYIDFLKKHTTVSDSHRRDALRRVYQRAVRNPMQNLDSFWREYSTFEQTSNTNKELARGLIAESQPKNIDARAEFRARRSRREGLTLTALPVPPRGRAKESGQAQQWRRFIAHERTNPFSLNEPELNGRIMHAFESALGPMYRYPDVWIEYLSYVYGSYVKDGQSAPSKPGSKETGGGTKEDSPMKKAALALDPLLERAINALPGCVALHVHVNWLHVRLGSASKGVTALDNLCKRYPSPLAYIHLMRATRKADGRDTARKVFGRARKDSKGNDPAVYVAAALMEFQVNKDSKVARNVFEFGLKNNTKCAVMALEYVNWLWGLGDLEYARVVLKKVMPDVTGSSENVCALWERWLELEEIIGDTASVDQVEAMWKEKDPSRTNKVVQDVLRRARFLTFEGLSENDISSIDGVRKSAAEKSSGGPGLVTGKRDPRTGKRVVSSAGGKDGGGGTDTGSKRGDAASHGNVLRTATEWLQQMAAGLPNITAPPPSPEVLFRMLLDMPESFSDTPAGANTAAVAGPRKARPEQLVGKKRKGEDALVTQAMSAGHGPGNVVPPTQDVFRARQAAKQSRMR